VTNHHGNGGSPTGLVFSRPNFRENQAIILLPSGHHALLSSAMSDLLQLFFVFIIGVATGFVDSTVANGGLISIPLLTFIGLPPHVALLGSKSSLNKE
jgi:hypothetical protein